MNDSNIELLEAEGELNKQVQSALDNFRDKLLQNASPLKREPIKSQINEHKEGPEKRFQFRESLLSIMFEIRDFQTMYNIALSSFIILTLSLFYESYTEKGQIMDKISMMACFNGIKTLLLNEIMLGFSFFSSILVVKVGLRVNRYIWIPVYICQMTTTMCIGTHFARSDDLGFASVIIIMAEAVRIIMKSHSYVRTKLLYLKDNHYKDYEFRGIKVINCKIEEKEEVDSKRLLKINITNGDVFSQIKRLSYFFWAPTLIYRDSYVLTPVRSFRQIIVHFINFLACIYYSFIMYQGWYKKSILELEKKIDFGTLCSTIINLMLPSMLFLIMGFFGFLHSWLNLFSQITRFPDRAFYSDWWNSVQFGSYYRKWNIVVHDWLYYYIYLDLSRFCSPLRKHRSIVQLITFIISAIIHELIIYFAIGFFYPILFILFAGPGILFMQISVIRKNSVNLIFWLEMYIGTSMMFTFYLVEVFARQKVGDGAIEEEWGWLSSLIPRTFYLGQP